MEKTIETSTIPPDIITDFMTEIRNNTECTSAKFARVHAFLKFGIQQEETPFRHIYKVVAEQCHSNHNTVRQSLISFYEDAWFLGNPVLMEELLGSNVHKSITGQSPNYRLFYIACVGYIKKISN